MRLKRYPAADRFTLYDLYLYNELKATFFHEATKTACSLWVSVDPETISFKNLYCNYIFFTLQLNSLLWANMNTNVKIYTLFNIKGFRDFFHNLLCMYGRCLRK